MLTHDYHFNDDDGIERNYVLTYKNRLLLYNEHVRQDSPLGLGQDGPGRVIFFPINAPGVGRFRLFNLGVLGYGLQLRFRVVIAKIVSLTLTITLITTLTII